MDPNGEEMSPDFLRHWGLAYIRIRWCSDNLDDLNAGLNTMSCIGLLPIKLMSNIHRQSMYTNVNSLFQHLDFDNVIMTAHKVETELRHIHVSHVHFLYMLKLLTVSKFVCLCFFFVIWQYYVCKLMSLQSKQKNESERSTMYTK